MAKFCGKIGYILPVESPPGSGVIKNQPIERTYRGEITRNVRRWESGEGVNDDLNISNNFSVVADSFSRQNLGNMAYIYYMGTRWKIKNIEIAYPRLYLTVGGLYNGPTPISYET